VNILEPSKKNSFMWSAKQYFQLQRSITGAWSKWFAQNTACVHTMVSLFQHVGEPKMRRGRGIYTYSFGNPHSSTNEQLWNTSSHFPQGARCGVKQPNQAEFLSAFFPPHHTMCTPLSSPPSLLYVNPLRPSYPLAVSQSKSSHKQVLRLNHLQWPSDSTTLPSTNHSVSVRYIYKPPVRLSYLLSTVEAYQNLIKSGRRSLPVLLCCFQTLQSSSNNPRLLRPKSGAPSGKMCKNEVRRQQETERGC